MVEVKALNFTNGFIISLRIEIRLCISVVYAYMELMPGKKVSARGCLRDPEERKGCMCEGIK